IDVVNFRYVNSETLCEITSIGSDSLAHAPERQLVSVPFGNTADRLYGYCGGSSKDVGKFADDIRLSKPLVDVAILGNPRGVRIVVRTPGIQENQVPVPSPDVGRSR